MSDSYVASYDRFNTFPISDGPARRALVVTPNDTKDLTNATGNAMPAYAKALYIGVSGDVAVIGVGDTVGNSVTFKAHPVGYLPVQVRRVLATGTTATNILALMD